MKRMLGAVLALLSVSVLAQTTTPTANSWEMRQRNENNNGVYTYYIVPDGAVDQIPTYNGGTNKPEYSKLGTGLSRSGTTLNVSLSASQITGTTATGQALMTAADATAARAAIGAGTVTSVIAGTGLAGSTITSSGTISLPSIGTAGTYSGITTDAQGRVSAGTIRSFAYTTRALNTCYQISGTRDALVSYAVEVTSESTLAAGQLGTVYLETFTDSGCTTGTQEIMRGASGIAQSVGLSVTLTSNGTITLHGVIPAGLYVKQRTDNTTGTPSFAARPGEEVLL